MDRTAHTPENIPPSGPQVARQPAAPASDLEQTFIFSRESRYGDHPYKVGEISWFRARPYVVLSARSDPAAFGEYEYTAIVRQATAEEVQAVIDESHDAAIIEGKRLDLCHQAGAGPEQSATAQTETQEEEQEEERRLKRKAVIASLVPPRTWADLSTGDDAARIADALNWQHMYISDDLQKGRINAFCAFMGLEADAIYRAIKDSSGSRIAERHAEFPRDFREAGPYETMWPRERFFSLLWGLCKAGLLPPEIGERVVALTEPPTEAEIGLELPELGTVDISDERYPIDAHCRHFGLPEGTVSALVSRYPSIARGYLRQGQSLRQVFIRMMREMRATARAASKRVKCRPAVARKRVK